MYDQFLAFLLFIFLGSVTPGPNNILLTTIGCNVGIRRGLPFLLGTAAGIAAMGFALVLAVGQIILVQEYLANVIRFLGICMLCWLAWKIATASVAKGADVRDNLFGRSPASGFMEAVCFQWVNPKVWMVSVSAISAFYNPEFPLFIQSIIFSSIFSMSMICGGFVWLAVGASLSRMLENATVARIFNICMAMLLMLSMVPILFMQW